METTDSILHKAVIKRIDWESNTLTAVLSDNEDCGVCPASRICGAMSADKSRTLTVKVSNASAFHVGEEVELEGTARMHHKAVMLATVLPAIALVAIMTAIYMLTFNQLAAALSGLGAMILFFIVLYLCRDKVAKEFNFIVKKTE